MADQRTPAAGWEGLPSPGEPGWSGWCRHWLAVHSSTTLNQQAAAVDLSQRAHGRLLWRHLVDRLLVLEADLGQEQTDGITDRALRAREGERLQELEETREALRILELIGPHLPGAPGR